MNNSKLIEDIEVLIIANKYFLTIKEAEKITFKIGNKVMNKHTGFISEIIGFCPKGNLILNNLKYPKDCFVKITN